MKHGKHYVDAAKQVDFSKLYDMNEALELACKTASAKFDETVELHVRLGVDGRHADQQVRGAVVLPNGTGKTVRVCAIAKGAAAAAAEAAGADGLIIPKRRSASLNATVFKTSAGAAAWLKVARVANLVDTIKRLKEAGVWVYGMEADGTPIAQADLSGAVALVVGSEGFGLGRLVRENCDMTLSLPMFGKVNSLNASVSAGIIMYEVVKHRG